VRRSGWYCGLQEEKKTLARPTQHHAEPAGLHAFQPSRLCTDHGEIVWRYSTVVVTVRTPDHAAHKQEPAHARNQQAEAQAPRLIIRKTPADDCTPWCRATTTRRLAGDLFRHPRLKSPRPPTRTSRPAFLVFACGVLCAPRNSICRPTRIARNDFATCIKVPGMQGRLKILSLPQPVSNGATFLACILGPIWM